MMGVPDITMLPPVAVPAAVFLPAFNSTALAVVLLVLTLSPRDAAVDPLAVAAVTGSADPFQSYPAPEVRGRLLRAPQARPRC